MVYFLRDLPQRNIVFRFDVKFVIESQFAGKIVVTLTTTFSTVCAAPLKINFLLYQFEIMGL